MRVKFPDLIVKCHPVNQAGSSSNEIGDVDFINQDSVSMCAELKDKEYTVHDVRHAVDKSIKGGCGKLLIIEGLRGRISSSEGEIANLLQDCSSLGVDLIKIKLDKDWIRSQLNPMTPNKLLDTLASLRILLDEVRASDDARDWLNEVLERRKIRIEANT